MKIIGLILFCISVNAYGQLAFYGGATTLLNVGKPVKFGLNAGLEYYTDESTSYYGRVLGTFRQSTESMVFVSAIDPLTAPSILTVNASTGIGFLNIEAGKRMYLIGSNDYGFSAYGGTSVGLTTLGLKQKLRGDYDESKYYYGPNPTEVYDTKSRLYLLNLGLNGGVNYTFSRFALFAEMSGYFNTNIGVTSNNLITNYIGDHVSVLMFSVNFGIKKNLFY